MHLLKCIAKAVLKNSGRLLVNVVPGGEVLFDIAQDAWQHYREESREASLRAEVEALAQASPEQTRGQVKAVVQAVAGNQPKDLQLKLTSYLTQVPAMIRSSLKRPSDPDGASLPAQRRLKGVDDLLLFLPRQMPRFQPGDKPLLGVDWVLEELLGVGGFGEVWKARNPHIASMAPVALKFCLNQEAANSLFNEAGALDQVMLKGHHDGIVKLQQTFLSALPPCLQYEYVEGGDLAGLIRDEAEQHRLTPQLATGLLLQLARTVAFAHQAGIVHCDLKPANVLVQRLPGKARRLRVADFGIGGVAAGFALQQANREAVNRRTLLTQAVRGAYTPLYASPQQMKRRPDERADPRDDVHALGVIWYQLVTGELSLMTLPPDWHDQLADRGLTEELIELLGECISSKEERRPKDAGVLVKRLERQGKPSSTNTPILTPVKTPAPLPRPVVKPKSVPSMPTPAPLPEPVYKESPRSSSSALGFVVVFLVLAVTASLAWLYLPDIFKPANTSTPPGPEPKLPNEIKVIQDDLGLQLVYIPPGKFQMGSPLEELDRQENETQHWVTLSKGFYLGKYEVTQAQWQSVMGNNPCEVKGDNLPVGNVSFKDCQEFLRRLKERTGKTYRLPTEAEWEYACRAGTTTAYHAGKTLDAKQAAFFPKGAKEKSPTAPQPVGSFPANAWGLHDMHGNVREWCQDFLDDYQGDAKDPCQTKGAAKVLRGGYWFSFPEICRSACRFGVDADLKDAFTGLRVCRNAD